MKPPVSYYGGKQRMARHIVPLLPRHTVYVEPFCGGAAVLFTKPWPAVADKQNYREVINDKDGDLVNFYKQLRDNGEELCRLLELTPYSEAEHQLAKNADCPPLERARRYYISIMQSFSKERNAGWGRAVSSQNHATGWSNKVAGLHRYVARMAGVYIACQDALTIIDQWDSPQTLFYCDPPYPGADQGHYAGYTAEDYALLVEKLDAAAGNVVLSCYDVPGVTIPDDWETFSFSAQMSAKACRRDETGQQADRGETERTELVYRRFNRVPVRLEIQRLYDSGAYNCFAFPPGEKRQLELV